MAGHATDDWCVAARVGYTHRRARRLHMASQLGTSLPLSSNSETVTLVPGVHFEGTDGNCLHHDWVPDGSMPPQIQETLSDPEVINWELGDASLLSAGKSFVTKTPWQVRIIWDA